MSNQSQIDVNRLTVKTHKLAVAYAKENGFPDNLTGMCAITAVSLYLILKVYGLAAKLIHGKVKQDNEIYHHCWVTLDGKVYDPTFGQFRKDHMCYIGESTFIHDKFTDIEEVTSLSVFSTWLNSQQPKHSRLEYFTKKLLKQDYEFNF